CSELWSLEDDSLDVVFTSNFLEHLSTKSKIEDTLDQARRCLKPGGKIILIGPNIRYVPGAYWDFWDHHIALSERSVVELLELKNFSTETVTPRFLPYTMSDGKQPAIALVKLYLRLPFLWPLFGKQFLVVAKLCS
ncbi:MAG: SAM-dependent methyltransferase, partial [Halieaceae bacterium]